MALRAARQDHVFKARIADRIVIVFHSWLQMFHFSEEGFGIHSLSCFKLVLGDFDPFIFSGITALTTKGISHAKHKQFEARVWSC